MNVSLDFKNSESPDLGIGDLVDVHGETYVVVRACDEKKALMKLQGEFRPKDGEGLSAAKAGHAVTIFGKDYFVVENFSRVVLLPIRDGF